MNMSSHLGNVGARFGNPVATATNWGPVRCGGSGVGAHRLVHVSPTRMEFVPSIEKKLFSLGFVVVGVVVLFFPLITWTMLTRASLAILISVSFMSGGLGILSWWVSATPRVFETSMCRFWRGRTSRIGRILRTVGSASIRLDDLHALQIVAKWVRQSAQRYNGIGFSGRSSLSLRYELNVVAKDGHRLNIVQHGNARAIRADAQRLGAFLGVPLWDASRETTTEVPHPGYGQS